MRHTNLQVECNRFCMYAVRHATVVLCALVVCTAQVLVCFNTLVQSFHTILNQFPYLVATTVETADRCGSGGSVRSARTAPRFLPRARGCRRGAAQTSSAARSRRACSARAQRAGGRRAEEAYLHARAAKPRGSDCSGAALRKTARVAAAISPPPLSHPLPPSPRSGSGLSARVRDFTVKRSNHFTPYFTSKFSYKISSCKVYIY